MSKYEYRQELVDDVINFIENLCTHVKGDKAGERIELDEWQKNDILREAFGWIHKGSWNEVTKKGKRRYKTVYVEIPKGNAKSTLGAAIALYLLGKDVETGAEVYGVASDSAQARIIFETAVGMINQNEVLSRKLVPFRYSITKPGSTNFYKVLSGTPKGKHGWNPSAIIFDEVHEQPTRELWDTLTAGQMKRDQSICFAFTTAGMDRESICYELHDKAEKIKKGLIKDDSFLGLIYTVDDKKDISKVDTWREANPGLGTIISEYNLEIEYNKVIATPSYESTFRRLHLNQWVESRTTWIADELWRACDNKGWLPEFTGKCYGGIDLASVSDFTTFSVLFPDDDVFHLKTYYWLPDEKYRKGEYGIDYLKWKDYIITNPGNVTDHMAFAEFVMEQLKKYDFEMINYDPYIANSMFMQHLLSVLGDDAVAEVFNPFQQSIANLSEPTKEFERVVKKGKLNHAGDPVLRWMMSNVLLYTDPTGRNCKVNKALDRSKIDGVVSGIMAMAAYIMQDNEEDIYANRGVLTV